MLALHVAEAEPAVEHEGVRPRGDDAEVAGLAVLGLHEARPAGDGVVVLHAQCDEALVQSAVRVDLGHDLLSDVAALLEVEGILEPRLLRVDRVVDVGDRVRRAGLDAQDVVHDLPAGNRAGGDEGAPELLREPGSAVDAPARRARDGQADHVDRSVLEARRDRDVRVGGLEARQHLLERGGRARSDEGQRGGVLGSVHELDVLAEVVHLERLGERRRVSGRRRQPDLLVRDRQVEGEEHLALGREQQVAVARARRQRAHLVGEQAVQELGALAAARDDAAAVGLVEEQHSLGPGAVLVRNRTVREQEGRLAVGEARVRGLVQGGQDGSVHGGVGGGGQAVRGELDMGLPLGPRGKELQAAAGSPRRIDPRRTSSPRIGPMRTAYGAGPRRRPGPSA